VTRQQLYRWADGYRRRHDGDFPTLRQAARRFRTNLDAVEQATEDAKDFGLPVDLLVGIGIRGVGYAEHETRGDFEIETYDDDDCECGECRVCRS
jgi:hypothetical protein